MKRLVATFLLAVVIVPHVLFAAEATNSHSTALARASIQYWSITDASQSGLDYTSDHTEVFWLKLTTAPGSGVEYFLNGKYSSGGNQRSWTYTYEDSGGTKQFHVRTSANGSTVSEGTLATTLNASTWYHLAFAYDASAGDIEVFVNGSSVGTITGLNNSLFNSSGAFEIGTFNNGDGNSTNGQFDSYLSYAADLDSTQVAALYTTPCNPSTTNLTSWWQFNNNGDDSQGSNDLTNNNSATFTTDAAYTCASAAPNPADVIFFD